MFLATSLPSAIAIEQSASLSARVSLTPSPVIATTLPLFLSAFTMVYFCSGVTLPNTVNWSAICSTSLVLRFSSERYLSLFSTPTRCAIFDTVAGSSPEIIFISTPLSLNHCIVSIASSRICSSRTIRASSVESFPLISLSNFSLSDSARAIIRRPLLCCCLTNSSCSGVSLHPIRVYAPRK